MAQYETREPYEVADVRGQPANGFVPTTVSASMTPPLPSLPTRS